MNGFTADAITAFWCKMPSKHLDTALDVLSDMIKNPLFDKKELEKERKVIFEEIKMRRDNPLIYVYDKIQSYLYKPPFGIPLIGTYESMNSLDKNKILEKFRQVYRPNNLVLCVVGNADFGNLASFVEKTFGNEKGIIFQPKIQLKDEEGTEDREGIDQANMVFAYHAPLAQNKLSYAALVLNTLMAGGMSSRLFSEIREKRNLAYAVKGEENTTKDFSYNMIYIGAMKENIEKIKSLILGEFDKVASSLDENELNDVKNHVIGNHQISMEDSQGQMVNLLLHEIDGKVEDFYNFEKNILNVKLKEVQQLARIKKYSFFALAPK